MTDLDELQAKLDELAGGWTAATFGFRQLRSPWSAGESADVLARLKAAEEVIRASRQVHNRTPFAAWERWSRNGNNADADTLSEWTDNQLALGHALANYDSIKEVR